MARARQRLTRAAEMFVDGLLDKASYDALRDKAATDIESAQSELARLEPTQPTIAKLPSLDKLLEEAGGWINLLGDGKAPSRRDVLALLINRVVAVRVGHARYDVQIEWTPLGDALNEIASASRQSAA